MEEKPQFPSINATGSVELNTSVPSVQSTDLKKEFKLNADLLKQFQQIFNRKRNANKLPKEAIEKKLKAKKAARRMSNASRKINQAKNRKNKFTR